MICLYLLEDLTGQVQDLQEANETAVSELSLTQKKVEELEDENKRLQDRNDIDGVREENLRLRKQVKRSNHNFTIYLHLINT